MPVLEYNNITGNAKPGPFTAAQIAAINKEPDFSIHYPPVKNYDLATIAPNFDGQNGWFLVRFRVTTLPVSGDSDYVASINSGSSSEIVGFRLRQTSGEVQFRDYWRNNSNNYEAFIATQEMYANEVKTALFSWNSDGYKFCLIDDYFAEDTDPDQIWDSGVMDELDIGGRNGLQNPFVGEILYLEFGHDFLTVEEAVARRQLVSQPLIIATAGQSNIQNWEDGVETTGPFGREAILNQMCLTTATNYVGEVVQCHAAEGGSGIWKATNSTEYWLEDSGQPGVELIEFFNMVDKVGPPRFIIWDHGENATHKIDHASYPWLTKEKYKAGVLQVFEHMRNKYPGVQILIGKIGIRTSFSNPGGIQKVAESQQEIVDEKSWAHFAYERFDLNLWTDGVHYLDADYTTMATRAANKMLRLMGYTISGGTEGMKVTDASRSSTTVTVTVEHDGGTDFTPTTGIEGFSYYDSGDSEITISSAVRTNATTITLTLASAVAGTLYYMRDNESVTLSNLVKDNGANTLPLQRAKLAVA